MGIYGHPRRTPRWRRAALGAGALLICVTGVSAQAPSVPPGPSSGPSNEPAASGASGAERVFTECPVSLEAANAIAGEDLVLQQVYEGAPTFIIETIGDITTYTCGYMAPGDPSVASFAFSLSYTVDGSADRQWALIGEGLTDGRTAIDRLPIPAYENVYGDQTGSAEIALIVRGARSFIQTDVAAYGTDHSLDQVRTMVDAFTVAAIEALEGP
jgi:hypothetical protein